MSSPDAVKHLVKSGVFYLTDIIKVAAEKLIKTEGAESKLIIGNCLDQIKHKSNVITIFSKEKIKYHFIIIARDHGNN